MDNLLSVIKQAAKEAVAQEEPTAVLSGTVTKLNPLTVQIDQKLILTKEFLTVTKEVKSRLSLGKVILLKVQGGQKYLILGMEAEA